MSLSTWIGLPVNACHAASSPVPETERWHLSVSMHVIVSASKYTDLSVFLLNSDHKY